MVWVYGHYKYFYSCSAEIDFIRPNLTSVYVRFDPRAEGLNHYLLLWILRPVLKFNRYVCTILYTCGLTFQKSRHFRASGHIDTQYSSRCCARNISFTLKGGCVGLKVSAWKVGYRGSVPRFCIQVSKKHTFLPRSLLWGASVIQRWRFGLRSPGLEFRIMCMECSVISFISPSSGGSPVRV